MPFLPPNQQCQSTEGRSTEGNKYTTNIKKDMNKNIKRVMLSFSSAALIKNILLGLNKCRLK